MGNNLLKKLAIKIAKSDDERISQDLKFLEHLFIFSDEKYKNLSSSIQKRNYLSRYLPTKKQYRELLGLYYFSIENSGLTEYEFGVALKKQWINRYSYIREIRMKLPNLLNNIALLGPSRVVINYIKEIKKVEHFREKEYIEENLDLFPINKL